MRTGHATLEIFLQMLIMKTQFHKKSPEVFPIVFGPTFGVILFEMDSFISRQFALQVAFSTRVRLLLLVRYHHYNFFQILRKSDF